MTENKSLSECKEIYREAFGDGEPDFKNALFDTCFTYCNYLKDREKAVSMLFALPCEIVSEQKKIAGVYVYAAATLKAFRKRGYMSALLEKVKADTDGIVFLRPADENLIKFYEKCGFKKAEAAPNIKDYPCVLPRDGYLKLAKLCGEESGGKFCVLYYAKADIKIEKLSFAYSME